MILGTILTIIILNRLFGLDGLIGSQPIADYISIVVGLILALTPIHRMKPSEKYA